MNAPSESQGVRHPFPEPPAFGEARDLADGVLWMRLPLPMALDHVNVYALADADGWTLVDTGFATPETRALWQALLSGPLAGKPVRRVLVTHHHPDHVGLAGWFQSEFGAELLMPRTGWLYARMLILDRQERPAPETLAFWRAAGMDKAIFARRAAERPFNFADVVDPLPLGFTRLVEGQSLTLAGRRFIVRMGDGHAPEHATLWSEDDGLVIGGDQLLPGISPNLSVYPTEPAADPVGEWLASCQRLALSARPDQLVLPGHKLPFTGLPFRLEQIIGHHRSALARLVALLDRPRTAAECFGALYGREIKASEYGLALAEAVAHLNHLWHQGLARRLPGPEGAWHWVREKAQEAGGEE